MADCEHIEHCCALHGCKYSSDDCPVVAGTAPQAHLCEACTEEHIDKILSPDHPDFYVYKMTEQQLRATVIAQRDAIVYTNIRFAETEERVQAIYQQVLQLEKKYAK